MRVETANELKVVLDAYISKLVIVDGEGPGIIKIHVSPRNYQKAKYSCTADEKDFKFVNGRVYYKGFQLTAT